MNKSKALIIAVVILLVMNLALVGFMFLKKPSHHKHHAPKSIIIETLQLDQDQINAYEKLIKTHHETIMGLDEQLSAKKNQLYALLKQDSTGNSESELLAGISALQSDIEKTNLNHFRDIKMLCNAEQLPKFNELTEEIQKLFKPKSRKNRGDKKHD